LKKISSPRAVNPAEATIKVLAAIMEKKSGIVPLKLIRNMPAKIKKEPKTHCLKPLYVFR
jgi:hypothetical protein